MKRIQYSSDLTEPERLLLKDLILSAKFGGRPRMVEIREILNAVFYLLPPVARGDCCHTTFRNGKPSIIIGASGTSAVCGNGSAKLCAGISEERPVAMPEANRLSMRR